MRIVTLSFLAVIFLGSATTGAQGEVNRVSGGSMRTELGHGITVNKGSSLEREWVVVNHPGTPALFVGTPGVRTAYKPDRVRGEYVYETEFTLDIKEPLTAVRVHFLLFDVWGRHVRTLGFTEVADLEPGRRGFKGTWRAWSENDVAEYYASIAYIARVRTKSNRIIFSDTAAILSEAQKFSTKFSMEDLEPRADKR